MAGTEDIFRFDYYYQGKMVSCGIAPGESDYGIYFDDAFMGIIELNENDQWEIVGTGLDQDDVDRIGAKIKDHFE